MKHMGAMISGEDLDPVIGHSVVDDTGIIHALMITTVSPTVNFTKIITHLAKMIPIHAECISCYM